MHKAEQPAWIFLLKHESDALQRAAEQSQIILDKAILEVEKKYQEH